VDAVRNGTFEPKPVWYGLDHGIVDLSPMSDMVPADVQKAVLAKKEAITAGQAKVFVGPVKDQAGKERIPAGKTADDGALLGMDYFIQGVIGTTE
jgi:basic membrane protein A